MTVDLETQLKSKGAAMSDRTIYILMVDDGDQCKDYEFSNRQDAISEARRHYAAGAFSVQVYHYTNSGANRIDDHYEERP